MLNGKNKVITIMVIECISGDIDQRVSELFRCIYRDYGDKYNESDLLETLKDSLEVQLKLELKSL